MYEHRNQPLLTRAQFAARLARHGVGALGLIGGALLAGMVGYHQLESLSWIDSFVNAAMLLGGMGPVNPLRTDAGKIFAGCYALFAGLVFLIVLGVVMAPVAHRMLHRLHLESDDDGDADS